MRFGGHESFAIRDGWLHKGLRLLVEEPERLDDEHVADWLGVGRNMAKSICHWLMATGLGEAASDRTAKNRPHMVPTPFGRLVYDQDRYFTAPGTLWMLHVNLIHNAGYAASWDWFFNRYSPTRFERSVCLESLLRYLRVSQTRIPSLRTLERDIGCLLSTYARSIPGRRMDPEDMGESPFVELGLMTYYRSSGYYQVNQGVKAIPPEVFGYTMAMAFSETPDYGSTIDITLHDASRRSGAPGRVFMMTGEALFESVLMIEASHPHVLQLAGLAGDRVIRMRQQSADAWAQAYYEAETPAVLYAV
ncbi:MAG: DUF4007 family protein [Ardenticatenia bacterium]|nr:DUF4007 family protein [Ardenticatenia bacterium]